MSKNDERHAIGGLLRLPQVLELIPVSRSTWWAGVKSGRFPRAYKLGSRVTAWRLEDIQRFIGSIAAGTEN
jgi:prophage regulatory protein